MGDKKLYKWLWMRYLARMTPQKLKYLKKIFKKEKASLIILDDVQNIKSND